MSVDTYFCFCCLSTTDLANLFDINAENNYANMLKELFCIKVSTEDYEDDSYICTECARRLNDTYKFKIQVFETLNILQVNGLIKMRKTKGENYMIKKILNEYLFEVEEKCKDEIISKSDNEITNIDDNKYDPKQTSPEMKPIKQETIQQNISEYNKKTKPTPNELPFELLEREKRVAKEKKRKGQTKRELSYEVTEDFKCNFCSVVLPNIYVYHSHMNQHFPNHICETCGKGFLTEKRLKRHIPSHKTGPFKCQSCEAEFSNYNTLNSHRQRKHSTSLLYKCPHCDERFPTFTRRALHLESEHDAPSGKYACRVCDKKFLLAGNLSAHMRNKHLKIKKHTCPECGIGFFHRQELRGHMAAHTGLNEFQCRLCPKRYPRKKALDVHMRTHTDDKRFGCEVCGKRFVQKCTLMTHIKTHNRKEVTKEKNKKNIEVNGTQKVHGRKKVQMVTAESDFESTVVDSTIVGSNIAGSEALLVNKEVECGQSLLIGADMECYETFVAL